MARKRLRRFQRKRSSLPTELTFWTFVGLVTLAMLANSAKYIASFLNDFEYSREIFVVVVFLLIGISLIAPVYIFIKKQMELLAEDRLFEGLRTVSQVNDMDHHLFEYFVGHVLKNEDCKDVRVTPKSADEGIDLKLKKDGKIVLVQVKHYKEGHTIGRPELQKFVGAYQHKAESGWFITTSSFTAEAREYAKNFPGLRLIERSEFGSMMSRLPDDSWRLKFPTWHPLN